MKDSILIGLTGGIGSGKSTVAKVFELLGYPVFYADYEARQLYSDSEEVKRSVIDLFGKDAYQGDEVDRAFIAGSVFNDRGKLDSLNAIIHPAVRQRFSAWKSEQSHFALIREAAILFESGSHEDCDLVITVSAPEALRTERVLKRDSTTVSSVQERMKNQLSDAERKERADIEIVNDGRSLIIPQVIEADAFFRAEYGVNSRRL